MCHAWQFESKHTMKPTQPTPVHVVASDLCCAWCARTTPLRKPIELDDVVIGLFEGQFRSHQDNNDDRVNEIQLFPSLLIHMNRWHVVRVFDTFVCLFSLNESSTKGVSVDKMELVLQLKLMENHELCNKFTEFCLSGGRHHDDDDTNHTNALRAHTNAHRIHKHYSNSNGKMVRTLLILWNS